MSDAVKVGFVPFSAAARGILVVFCDDALKFGAGDAARRWGRRPIPSSGRRPPTSSRARAASTLDILAPEGIKAQRLIVIGAGKAVEPEGEGFSQVRRRGRRQAQRRQRCRRPSSAELPDGAMTPEQAAAIASGMRLRAYKFDRYKTKKKDGEDGALARRRFDRGRRCRRRAKRRSRRDRHVVDGVIIARELVNEPPNVLYPEEFARRASQLRKLGVNVEVLDVKAMTKLGMGALLGVGQGSARPSRTVIMRWNGGKKGEQPVAFVGKGVCFDTGGISIKRRRQHGGHEGRHGRRGLRRRPDACARGAQGQGQRGRRHRPRREHARRQRAAAGRHRHLDVGPDHRDHQHRRRRPPGAGRRALVRGEEVQAEIHGRSGDADRRDHGRARHRACRHVLQQ